MLYKNLLSFYVFIADCKLLRACCYLSLYLVAYDNFLLNEYDDDDDDTDRVAEQLWGWRHGHQ